MLIAELTLAAPHTRFESEFRAMSAEHLTYGEARYDRALRFFNGDFTVYVKRLHEHSRGVKIPAGRVPYTTCWLIKDDLHLLGTIRLRHRLREPASIDTLGHIGYDIRPSQRGCGYGTLLLSLMLDHARQRGMERLLITCRDDNLPSARIIEKNGGVLTDRLHSAEAGGLARRYWITL